jgi:hypothetical protein
MKHIVTISLVFFSLTHLSQTERVDGLRLLTERYCNDHKISREVACSSNTQLNEDRNPFFLSYNELTLIGILPETPVLKYKNQNQVIADLTIRKKPKNNSP